MVEKIDCTPAFIPAPFEMKAILQAETKDPLQLLLILKDAGTPFDNQNGATELMIHDSNPVSGSRIRQWLWAVGNGRIPAAVFWSDGDDGELREFSMRRHTECILPPIPASNTTVPVSIVDDPVKIAHEVKRTEEKEEEKEDRTKDWIPHLIKRMILNASSADGQRAASDFNSEFLNFFNVESAGAAGIYLYRYLRDNGLDDSVIDERAVLSMYYGDFISFNPNVFKDFCAFSFQEGSGLSPNQFEKFLMLHMSDGLVNIEHMNQTITVPKDYNKMVESAKRYNCAQRLLFTKESLIFKSYKKIVRELEENKSAIKDMIEEDPDICAKILYLAQTEIKLWSKRCMKCEDRKDVDDSYIDFKDIVRRIKTEQVHCILPACLKNNPSRKRNLDNTFSFVTKSTKNKKHPRIKNMTRVVNDNIFEAFQLLENEEYNIFTGQKIAKLRPPFQSTKMCPRWNIKGRCFADCPMKESHISHNKYSEEQRSPSSSG